MNSLQILKYQSFIESIDLRQVAGFRNEKLRERKTDNPLIV